MLPVPYFKSSDHNFTLLRGDCRVLLQQFDFHFNMVFADPPYFLSNGGISIQSGKVVSVNKGEWDASHGFDSDMAFNMEWISACRDKLTESGTIWISSTYHNVGMVLNCLQKLGFKVLNVITWEKTNPPMNVSCRFFTYSTEFIVWARKNSKTPHYFNYELMRALNGGKQMKDVWKLPAIAQWEKSCTKHPTQKPLALLTRIVQASTRPGDWVLDPFTGSSTTGIAANLEGRRFLGIDQQEEFLGISMRRRNEIEDVKVAQSYREKIARTNEKYLKQEDTHTSITVAEPEEGYMRDLPF